MLSVPATQVNLIHTVFNSRPCAKHVASWSFAFSPSVCMYLFLCIHTYHVHDNYVMYIVAVRP